MSKSLEQYPMLKKSLRLAINQLQLLGEKKSELAMKVRTEIADYIAANKPDRARIRVEYIIREDYVVEAFEILETYCHLLLGRFDLIEQMKTLDGGIAEAVISIMWAAPRLATDIAEFKSISDQLTTKYGEPFAEAARANQLEFPARVNPKVISKLGAAAPPKLLVERHMIAIATAAGVPFVPDQNFMKVSSAVTPSAKQDKDTNAVTLYSSEGKIVTEIDGFSLSETSKSAEFSEEVTALVSSRNSCFVAAGTKVYSMTNRLFASSCVELRRSVNCLLFVESRVIAIDVCSGVHVISVDSTSSLKLEHEWTGSPEFVITSACLPHDTYINKVLVGSEDGRMRMFNYASGKTVHQFEKNFNSKICIIQLSSCDDTIAVGCEDGRVTLFELNNKKIRGWMGHQEAISCLAFRPERKAIMLVGDVTGCISIWNFNRESLLSSFKAHSSSVQLILMHRGNEFISMSSDESVKIWKIVVDAEPRLLKERRGRQEEEEEAASPMELEETQPLEIMDDPKCTSKCSIDATTDASVNPSVPSWKCDWLLDDGSIGTFQPQFDTPPPRSSQQ